MKHARGIVSTFPFSWLVLTSKWTFGFQSEHKSCLRRNISKHTKVIFISWAARDNFPAVRLDRTSPVSRILKSFCRHTLAKLLDWSKAHYICWQSFWTSTNQTLLSSPVQIWVSQYFKKYEKKWPLKISYLESNGMFLMRNNNV